MSEPTLDQAREVAMIRQRRANHAAAVAHADLGAVILTSDQYSLVCRALLDAQRMLRSERAADAARQLRTRQVSPLEAEVVDAHDAMRSASTGMPS